jgi:hypothetical protein
VGEPRRADQALLVAGQESLDGGLVTEQVVCAGGEEHLARVRQLAEPRWDAARVPGPLGDEHPGERLGAVGVDALEHQRGARVPGGELRLPCRVPAVVGVEDLRDGEDESEAADPEGTAGRHEEETYAVATAGAEQEAQTEQELPHADPRRVRTPSDIV